MSQSDSASPADNGTNSNQQTDLSPLVSELSAMRDRLEALSLTDVAESDDVDLVELREELKQLEDITEEARKDVTENELRARVNVGGSLCGLKRVESHNKYVEDDTGTVVARAAALGVDYTEFVDLNASALADMDEDLADIGEYTYDYFL